MKSISNITRSNQGQAAAVLNLLLAVGVVGLLAVFCFELSRYFLSREELKTNTEAAALCCETTLVSSGDPTNVANQTNAVNAALTLFQQNNILGQSMNNALAQSTVSGLSPSPGQAQICFQFLDPVTRQPINTNQPGTSSTPVTGALIEATSAYCYTPALGQFIGLSGVQFTFQISASSGVPRIDVVLAFDISGGMDDQTNVTPSQRSANVNTGGGGTGSGGSPGNGSGTAGSTSGSTCQSTGLNYMYVNNANGSPVMGGSIASVYGNPGSAGASLPNALPPQNLENSGNFPNGPIYSEQPGAATNNLAGFNGNTNNPAYMGVSPGNLTICTTTTNGSTGPCPPYCSGGASGTGTYVNIPSNSGAPTTFTDLVVNLDSNSTFNGNYTSPNGFFYNDAGALVEASRANLENSTTAAGAFVDYSGMGLTPTTGYAADYGSVAQSQLQPLNNMINAAAIFVNEIANVADVHFSFIAFNDAAGNASTGLTAAQYSSTPQTGYVPMISSWFPYPAPVTGSTGSAAYILPALPYVALDPNNANANLINQLPSIRPNGNRNVAVGLQAAVNQLVNNSRTGANKAIILFVSGVPSEANASNSAALQDALNQAQQAAANGISIYCVTVADPNSTSTPTDDSAQDAAYNNNNGGIAAQSAPGPSIGQKYGRVDWAGPITTQNNLATIVDYFVRQMIVMHTTN